MVTYNDIISYCTDYSLGMQRGGGSLVFGSPTNIESIGINFSRLSREEARGLAVGLSYTLIHGRMNSIIMPDHQRYWDAIGKHLLEPPSLYFGESVKEKKQFPLELSYLRKLFITVIKTETSEWKMYESQVISGWSWPPSPQGYPVVHAVNPGEYFVYPLLEAILKKNLAANIQSDGKVITEFTINFENGNQKKYQAGQIVSQISHLIILLMQTSKDKELVEELSDIFSKIEETYNGRSAVDVISNEWRNSALHGERHTPTASGIVLNIVLLLAIASVTEDDWESRYEV